MLAFRPVFQVMMILLSAASEHLLAIRFSAKHFLSSLLMFLATVRGRYY